MKVFLMLFLYCLTFGDSKYHHDVPKIKKINELLGRFDHIIGDNFEEENSDKLLTEFVPENIQEAMDQVYQKYNSLLDYSISRLYKKRSLNKY